MKQLRLHLFCPFQARLEGVATPQFEAATARGLLAYLALHAGQPQAREQLAALLWGVDAGPTGLTNLRTALRRVRCAVGEEVATRLLDAERELIQCTPHAEDWVDVLQFEALLAAVKAHPHRRLQSCPWCITRLTQATMLYRGPLLADLHVNTVGFEEWQYFHRERLQRLAMQALYVLADYHLHHGAYAEAEHFARRQLALEAWNEEAHQQLMRILYQSGQRSAALAQYAICRTALATEQDVPPSPTTTAFYVEIRQARPVADREDAVQPNNLPQPLTGLIDRQVELDRLLQRLVHPTHRLTTVVGEGGVGKTRLALAAAQALVGCFADGVWFVALADLRASDDEERLQSAIALTIAEALGLALNDQQPPKQQLIAQLRARELLLVLDNFEHLLAGVGLVHDLLRLAPNLVILVTARQPLNFQAEYLVRLTGLVAPTVVDDPAAATYSAVALFVAQAGQRQSQWALTPATLPLVVQICKLVRGLPLGIELAAASLRQMSVPEIATGLAHNLDLLTGDQHDIPLRHRSLAAVFDQSWQLLSSQEQQIVVGVAIFQGGFDRSGAAAVTGVTPVQLADLLDKSLLQQDEEGRYHMHELLRQFVAQKAQPPAQQAMETAHSAYYLGLLQQQQAHMPNSIDKSTRPLPPLILYPAGQALPVVSFLGRR